MLAKTPTAKTWTKTVTTLQIKGIILKQLCLAVAQWVSISINSYLILQSTGW